ncbi:hypothetical protein F5Y17DRAFT_419393 [Xylariaceae sp. FL0594]|nr:hypothetical protein F5Y17DRAFT_419393 [Xylariaceae sp. FL0594]
MVTYLPAPRLATLTYLGTCLSLPVPPLLAFIYFYILPLESFRSDSATVQGDYTYPSLARLASLRGILRNKHCHRPLSSPPESLLSSSTRRATIIAVHACRLSAVRR